MMPNTKKTAARFVAAYYPPVETPQSKCLPTRETVREKPQPSARFQCVLRIYTAEDELSQYSVGRGQWKLLTNTKGVAPLANWEVSSQDDGTTLLTASCHKEASRRLVYEWIRGAGYGKQYEVMTRPKGSSDINAQFVPVKLALLRDGVVGWPTQGYFYHFIDGALQAECQIAGEGRWSYQLLCSDERGLDERPLFERHLSHFLLPYRIENHSPGEQYLLYRRERLSTEEWASLSSSWLAQHGLRLNMDAVIAAFNGPLTTEVRQEDIPPSGHLRVGHVYPFGDVWGQYRHPKLAPELVHIQTDSSVNQRMPVVMVGEWDGEGYSTGEQVSMTQLTGRGPFYLKTPRAPRAKFWFSRIDQRAEFSAEKASERLSDSDQRDVLECSDGTQMTSFNKSMNAWVTHFWDDNPLPEELDVLVLHNGYTGAAGVRIDLDELDPGQQILVTGGTLSGCTMVTGVKGRQFYALHAGTAISPNEWKTGQHGVRDNYALLKLMMPENDLTAPPEWDNDGMPALLDCFSKATIAYSGKPEAKMQRADARCFNYYRPEILYSVCCSFSLIKKDRHGNVSVETLTELGEISQDSSAENKSVSNFVYEARDTRVKVLL